MIARPRMTRRAAMALIAGSAAAPVLAGSVFERPTFAQGVSSRAVKPMPRGKPSGLPFNARFTDVADPELFEGRGKSSAGAK